MFSNMTKGQKIVLVIVALWLIGTISKAIKGPEPVVRKTAQETRQEKIAVLFSPWDGSCTPVENAIKASMHNPDSYKHVVTRYSDKGSYLHVMTTFRGSNAFGGVVTNRATAQVSLDGIVNDFRFEK